MLPFSPPGLERSTMGDHPRHVHDVHLLSFTFLCPRLLHSFCQLRILMFSINCHKLHVVLISWFSPEKKLYLNSYCSRSETHSLTHTCRRTHIQTHSSLVKLGPNWDLFWLEQISAATLWGISLTSRLALSIPK